MPTHTQPGQKTVLQSFTVCSGSSRKCLAALPHFLLLPQPSPTCCQQPPFSPPPAAWMMPQMPPHTAGPHRCPVAAGVVAVGPWPLRLATFHLPQHLPQHKSHLGPTSYMEMDAKAPLFADAETVPKVTRCDMSPGENKSILCLFYQRLFLSASVISDCI